MCSFKNDVISKFPTKQLEEVTLHVGAGTFKPVKSETLEGHEMHTEFISVRRSSIEKIQKSLGNIIAVGTTWITRVLLNTINDPAGR